MATHTEEGLDQDRDEATLTLRDVGLRAVHKRRDGQAEALLLLALLEELLHHAARPLAGELPLLRGVGDVGRVEAHGEKQPHVLAVGLLVRPRRDPRLELGEMVEVELHVGAEDRVHERLPRLLVLLLAEAVEGVELLVEHQPPRGRDVDCLLYTSPSPRD